MCGVGLRFPGDLTLETLAALRAATRIFALPSLDFSTLKIASDVVDLTRHYGDNIERSVSYEAMTSEILEAACESPPIAFVTYGHALVGSDTGHAILAGAKNFNLVTHVCGSPSSIEAVAALLGIDIFEGFQLHEATRFTRQMPEVDIHSWLFLTQVPYVGTLTGAHQRHHNRFDSKALEQLSQILVSLYGPGHRAWFVRSAVLDHEDSVTRVRLDELVDTTPNSAATLVVEPLVRETPIKVS